MPAGPGETLLTTLFGDVHYYFSAPSTKPQHHRFDRGSYVYLFHNASENRAKLEIANHAGTPDQDAFSGYLDIANVTYSHKQPTLFTINIDSGALQGHDQWHLPSYNERNEQKYLYKIHTLDIYLWTESDGSAFLKHLRTVLPASKLDVRDAPPAAAHPSEHQDSMSSVVQQLEQTAISPQFTPQRQESDASKQSKPASPPAASPAPMAYNPAAPAAPEPISHREKTPPPPDAESGTGLDSAARYDNPQYGNVPNTFGGPQNQPTHHQAYFPGPPQQQRNPSLTSFPGPPQGTPPGSNGRPESGSIPPPPGSRSSSQQYAPSFAGPPTHGQSAQPTSPPPNQQSFGRQPSFGAPVQQYASYPQQTPSFGPNAIASPGLPSQQRQQQQPPTPSAPPGYSPGQYNNPHDYGQYDYNAAQAAQPYGTYGGYSGDVHNQAYRPTAEEAAHGHGKQRPPPPPPPQSQSADTRQRVEQRMASVESKMGKFLKRLDRAI